MNTETTFDSSKSSSTAEERSPRQLRMGLFGLLAVILAASSLVSGSDATATTGENIGGTQKVYGAIPPDQVEHISSPDRIKSTVAKGSMMAIWETLEHGERVECLDCIPSVEPLLYDSDPRTREIAAWWLRRRIFGVFGKGQVYERTLQTLSNDPDPVRRMYAANALGEFLAQPGITACATALKGDADPRVRAAAALSLGRLNDDGSGAVGQAMGDPDSSVKLAALRAAGRINAFKNPDALVALSNDGDSVVRRNTAELIGGLRVASGVDALMALARDPDANVRNAAAHSLGALHDLKARPVLDDLSKNDPDRLVRDQAAIALRRL